MTKKYIDFDRAAAERRAKKEPLVIRYQGKDWELPGTMAAAAVVKVVRLQVAGKAEHNLSEAELLDVAMDMIPKKILDQWLADGMSVEDLGVMVLKIFEAYQEMYQGEAKAPETGAPQSSSLSDGQSSRPTSPENISAT